MSEAVKGIGFVLVDEAALVIRRGVGVYDRGGNLVCESTADENGASFGEPLRTGDLRLCKRNVLLAHV